jgi:hypothetical protein
MLASPTRGLAAVDVLMALMSLVKVPRLVTLALVTFSADLATFAQAS